MIHYYITSQSSCGYHGIDFTKAITELNRLNDYDNNRDIYLKMALREHNKVGNKYQLGILDFAVNTSHGWTDTVLSEGEQDTGWDSVKGLLISSDEFELLETALQFEESKKELFSIYTFTEAELVQFFAKYNNKNNKS